MVRIALMIIIVMATAATAATFEPAPYLVDGGVDVLTREVARQSLDRDLFGSPYATVVVGRVDVYEGFPFIESRYFQIVSDPGWNRLVFGESGRGLEAFDGSGSSFGPLEAPRGMDVDDRGRVYVADTGNDRVLVFTTVTEFDQMSLVPAFAIEGLNAPHDVAFSDGGTPFETGDDALFVANTGRNEVQRYGLTEGGATLTSRLGDLGSGAGYFAGPTAVTVGRRDGVHTDEIYVADAHNGRVVELRDHDGSLAWQAARNHDRGIVTSLDADHWGNVYLAGPDAGVAKYTRGLKAVADVAPAGHRPRGFHVPSVTLTDHRTGTRQRTGEGRGLLVEEWDAGSGLRVMNLGVEARDVALATDGEEAVDLFLTDQASVTVELRDGSGELVSKHAAGAHEAGPVRVALRAPDTEAGWEAGDYRLTLRAESTYEDRAASETTMTVSLSRSGNPELPRALKVVGNAPNPFNPSTTISFLVPAGNHDSFSLNVYDMQGRLVRRLGSGRPVPGRMDVVWDGRSETGEPVPSGIYLYRVAVGAEKVAGKMVLLK